MDRLDAHGVNSAIPDRGLMRNGGEPTARLTITPGERRPHHCALRGQADDVEKADTRADITASPLLNPSSLFRPLPSYPGATSTLR